MSGREHELSSYHAMGLLTTLHASAASLPPEILASVFRENTHHPAELISLACVCRNWHDIVLGTGELWNQITIDGDTSEKYLRRKLELSGKAQLVLDLTSSAPVTLSQLVLDWNSPRPILERISSLEIHIPEIEDNVDDSSMWRPFLGGECWPQLKKLRLLSHHWIFRAHFRAPKLEILDLYQVDVDDWEFFGFCSTLFDASIFTDGPRDDIAAFLRVATRCPNLRRLVLLTELPNSLASFMPTGDFLWPNLTEIKLECDCPALPSVMSILVNAPRLNELHLQFGTMTQSMQTFLPYAKFTPSLCELDVVFGEEADDRSEYLLRLALMQNILDLYDLASLEKVNLEQVPIPESRFLALCSQLQDVRLDGVTLPHDFMKSLGRCPSVRYITVYDCAVGNNSLSVRDAHMNKRALRFNGDTFSEAYMPRLWSLDLHDAIVYPEFIVQLARFTRLNWVELMVSSESVEQDTMVFDWPDIDTIVPLPGLCRLNVGISYMVRSHPCFSLLNPAARFLVSAAARLGHDMPGVDIRLQSAPLRATDLAQCLCRPGRTLVNVKVTFKSYKHSPEILGILFNSGVVDSNESFTLDVGIERGDLSSVVDTICSYFPLESDIKAVHCNEEALGMIRMTSNLNPDSAGLRSLLGRAQATADKEGLFWM